MAKYIVGCDIGGTFTDLFAIDLDTKEQRIAKVLSTPPEYTDGVINGLNKLDITPSDVAGFKHGATISTNAVLQRRGAKTGLILTEGFKGLFVGGRSERMGAFELNWDPPPFLVLPRDTFGARERVSPDGEVLTPLNEDDVRYAARCFRKRGMQAIAVCYMDSYMNPIHELRTKEILQQECPDMFITISYEVLPRMLEFERTSTTVLNAYLGPVMYNYIDKLQNQLRGWGYKGEIVITHSAGGTMSIDEALKLPARTTHSSPVSGVVGLAGYIGELTGFDNVIAFESGGTTNDVSVIHQGKPTITMEWRILWNVPYCMPSIETVYIGAGGGSIAWLDAAKEIKVGPQSQGADPGPACFGHGGTEATNTDAQLILGRLNAKYFLGGELPLYPELAAKAIKEKIAGPFGWSVEQAADAIYRVAIANLSTALRLQTVTRGWDVRDFALVAYGGSSPMFAVDLAKELNIPTTVIPPLPGYASAVGATRLDMRHDLTAPLHKTESELNFNELNNTLDNLEKRGKAILEKEGVAQKDMTFQRFADVKYFNQSRTFHVDVSAGRVKDLKAITDSFLKEMKREYGYILPTGYVEVELVSLGVTAIGAVRKPELAKITKKSTLREALKEKRQVYFHEAGGFTEATIYDRSKLPGNTTFDGPAVVEQPDTTTVMPPGSTGVVDDYGNLVIRIK